MKPTRILVIALVGLLVGALTGIGIKMLRQAERPAEPAEAPVLEQMPEFAYPDLDGHLRHGNEWKTNILVLNFWAAWCPPCREETPLFVDLQEQYARDNVRFVGIAIDDREPVADFVDTYGVEYPVLLGDLEAIALSRRLGNRFDGLPFTVVVEPGGRILARFAGGVSREQIEPVLQQAIENNRRSYASPERI